MKTAEREEKMVKSLTQEKNHQSTLKCNNNKLWLSSLEEEVLINLLHWDM
jgi:hypothetical protein